LHISKQESPNKMKNIITAVLAIIILGLSYMVYQTIETPIKFQQEKKKRYAKVIERLKDIRTAEFTYRTVHNKYTGDFDTLINFLKTDSIPVVKKIGSIPDSLLDSITTADAIKMGLIVRDTIYMHVADTILKGKSYDSLRYVPFTNKAEFKLDAGQIKVSGTWQDVFEAKDSKPFDPTQVLQVGSMTEVSTSGNWE